MVIRRIHIRHWDILFYFSFDGYNKERILEALVWAEAPDSVVSSVSQNIGAGQYNEGFCFSNPDLRRTVVGIGQTDSGPEFLNTTIHEIVHVAQHIAREEGIDPYGEEFAYLAGDISREISYVVCEMSCPHCRGE